MNKGNVILPPDAVERKYQSLLVNFARQMSADLLPKIKKLYASSAPQFSPLAQDAKLATNVFEGLFEASLAKWLKKSTSMADKYAAWFAGEAEKATTKKIKTALKDIGFTVEFKQSDYVMNILGATTQENVDLIKSIPQQFHDRVKGIVMRGVQNGQDGHYIATELQKQFGITERRARFIARDQVQKANSAIAEARSQEAGIEYGFWRHRPGSKKPRPTHLEMQGKRYKLSEGLYDSAVKRKVKPGELPGCLCAYRPDLDSFNPKAVAPNVTMKPVNKNA